jgi:hypothetical protein
MSIRPGSRAPCRTRGEKRLAGAMDATQQMKSRYKMSRDGLQ